MRKKSAPQPKPGVAVGDHVYFRCDDGPAYGCVLACGRHGITVEQDGKRRTVYWHDVLGHKQRARPSYRVLDRGEDGVIAEDERGRRVFIAGALPDDEPDDEQDDDMAQLQKSILLLKALKDRPGLSLQQTTDKQGNVVRRWKKTGPDPQSEPRRRAQAEGGGRGKGYGAHNVAVGDQVSYSYQGAEHRGQVIAAGKDGVTVKHAETGAQHRVFWHEIGGREQGARDEPGKQDAEAIAKSLFDASDVQGLTEDASQPVNDKEALYQKSAEALTQMTQWLTGVAKELNLKRMTGGMDEVDWNQPGGMLFIAPLKGEKRAAEKVDSDYDGDWSKLLDVVRASIAVDTMDELKGVLDELKAGGMKLAKLPKNRFAKPTSEGYRDLMMNITLPNGIVGELQLHVKPILKAKEDGHEHYETIRSLVAKYGVKDGKPPPEDWDADDRQAYRHAVSESRRIYGEAWQQVVGGKTAADGESDPKMMQKAFSRPILLLLVRR